jgi:CheY-like chemotaxis protein
LVVEPDDASRRLIESELRGLGCRVVAVESAASALELVTTEPNFALVVAALEAHPAREDWIIRLRDSMRPTTTFAVLARRALAAPGIEGVVCTIRVPYTPTDLTNAVKVAIERGRELPPPKTVPPARRSKAPPPAAAAPPRDRSQSGTRLRPGAAVIVEESVAGGGRRDPRRER